MEDMPKFMRGSTIPSATIQKYLPKIDKTGRCSRSLSMMKSYT